MKKLILLMSMIKIFVDIDAAQKESPRFEEWEKAYSNTLNDLVNFVYDTTTIDRYIEMESFPTLIRTFWWNGDPNLQLLSPEDQTLGMEYIKNLLRNRKKYLQPTQPASPQAAKAAKRPTNQPAQPNRALSQEELERIRAVEHILRQDENMNLLRELIASYPTETKMTATNLLQRLQIDENIKKEIQDIKAMKDIFKHICDELIDEYNRIQDALNRIEEIHIKDLIVAQVTNQEEFLRSLGISEALIPVIVNNEVLANTFRAKVQPVIQNMVLEFFNNLDPKVFKDTILANIDNDKEALESLGMPEGLILTILDQDQKLYQDALPESVRQQTDAAFLNLTPDEVARLTGDRLKHYNTLKSAKNNRPQSPRRAQSVPQKLARIIDVIKTVRQATVRH